MQTTKNHLDEGILHTQQALNRMPAQANLSGQAWLPVTREEMADYIEELIGTVPNQPLPHIQYAIGDDIEHFKAIEDFVSSDETLNGLVEFLNHEEEEIHEIEAE